MSCSKWSAETSSPITTQTVYALKCLDLQNQRSLQSVGPKEEHQNNHPNNTPTNPSDVGVSRLPF
jgi:hypothetical protein